MVARSPVRKEKDPGIIRLGNFPGQSGKIQIQFLGNQYNSNNYCRNHKQGLQGIRPDNGLDTTPESVQPDQQDGDHDCCPEGNIPAAENADMKNTGNQEEAEGGPDDP